MIRALALLGLSVPAAHAQNVWDLWQPVCDPLQPGCRGGPENIFATTLPNLAIILLQIVTGFAVLIIVWAGFQMVLNLGDEGRVGKQKTNIFYALAGLFVAISSQMIVSIVATHPWNAGGGPNLVINVIAAAVGGLLTIFNGVFVIAIVYYGMRMLMASGDSGAFNNARTGITWAIVGAIVVNLANALVQGVTSYFGL